MYCIQCGNKLNSKTKYCSKCGNKVGSNPNECPNCKETIDNSLNFCKNCGYEYPNHIKSEPDSSKIIIESSNNSSGKKIVSIFAIIFTVNFWLTFLGIIISIIFN